MYVVPITVGNTQNLSVQVDTGSSDLVRHSFLSCSARVAHFFFFQWIASTSCNTQACKQTGGRLYDPSHSSATTKQFDISYVEGYVEGPIVWDAVTIGGYSITSQALGALYHILPGNV